MEQYLAQLNVKLKNKYNDRIDILTLLKYFYIILYYRSLGH